MKVRRQLLFLIPLGAAAVFLFLLWVGSSGEIEPEAVVVEEPVDDVFLPYEPVVNQPPGVKPEVAGVPVPIPEMTADALPGEYTVGFADPADMEAFIEAAEARGLRVLDRIPGLGVLRIGGSREELSALLSEDMEVGLNHRIELPVLPDPGFWEGRNLAAFNEGVLDFLGIPLDPDWPSRGEGLTVAVLDTGGSGHSAFGDRLVRELDLLGTPREGEYTGHGTAVAGLIGSTNPFAPGVAPGSELISIRVLDGNGSGDSFTLARGIIAAVNEGAEVINMSLGGYSSSRVLEDAVAYAHERGVVLVSASGNDGQGRVTFPAAYPTVIGVSAVDANGSRAPFSNFGGGIDVAAPGFQINAVWDEDQFIAFDGTSASAALVSGLAARVLQNGTARTPDEVRQLIREQANEAGPPAADPQFGAGIVNAERLEQVGRSGVFDMALADLYPATEETDGATFPLYISLQNRGTEFVPETSLEILVNGTPYHYRFSGLNAGASESIQIPVSEADLETGEGYGVSARVTLPEAYEDKRPENDAGSIRLRKVPGG
jgi:hypothetical protein